MRSRRLASVVVACALAVLTACGGGGATASDADVNSAEAKEFRELVGLTDTDLKNLEGNEFKLGAILPMSGTGAVFGEDQQKGVALAVDHMRKYVGLNVTYEVKDHKSGDPQAATQAARDLAVNGHGAVITSFIGVFGSLIKPAQQYKMLTFDAGGGTGNSFKGQDYFWGLRANVPDDSFYGLKYFAETNPKAKKVAMVVWDAGQAFYGPIEEHLKKRVAENGMTYSGRVLSKIGATDYSVVLSKLKDMDADLVFTAIWGDDVGHFMKQYDGAGIDAQVIGPEYIPATAKIAGSAFDDLMIASDYFSVSAPPNPFSEFFIKSHRDKYGEDPATYYAANYYETALAYLQLAARVAADGGDINSGEDLQKALLADPKFASVYGGDADNVGTLEMNKDTHDPEVRPVSLFRAGDDAKQLATWNIGGSSYKTLR